MADVKAFSVYPTVTDMKCFSFLFVLSMDFRRQAGEVVYCDVMKEPDGRSKGCGIVEFSTSEEAQEAIKTLTDTELKGRMIFVREDREISSGGGGFGGRGGGGGGSGCSVYVGNLSYETSWQDLKDVSTSINLVSKAFPSLFMT